MSNSLDLLGPCVVQTVGMHVLLLMAGNHRRISGGRAVPAAPAAASRSIVMIGQESRSSGLSPDLTLPSISPLDAVPSKGSAKNGRQDHGDRGKRFQRRGTRRDEAARRRAA